MSNTPPPRSQAGIGRLVVFVAMVLVVSIAAGVLVNTAGLQGSQSEGTGQESGARVPGGLLVVGQTGSAVQDGSVGRVNLTVTKAAGAGDVDLRATTVTWVGPDGAHNVVSERAAGTSGDATFRVTALTDPSDSVPVLDDADDRMILTVDLGSTDDVAGLPEFGERLGPGDQVNLALATGGGTTTRTRLAVPRWLSDADAVAL